MKVRFPYTCDYCMSPKGETNHWWLHPTDGCQFILQSWDAELADRDGYEHICSESCAAKALSQWMNSQLPSSRHSRNSELDSPLVDVKNQRRKVSRVASILPTAG